LVPKNKYILAADISLGYSAGGFAAEASITLGVSESLKLKVGAKYTKATGFQILGLDQLGGAAESNEDHSLAHKEIPFPTIPLLTVGVATLGLHFGMGIDAGYKMPKFKFDTPQIEGGLDGLEGNGLPPITFGGNIEMGAYVSFFFNVQIV